MMTSQKERRQTRIAWLKRNVKFRDEVIDKLTTLEATFSTELASLYKNNVYELAVRAEVEQVISVIRKELAHVTNDKAEEIREMNALEAGRGSIDTRTGFGVGYE